MVGQKAKLISKSKIRFLAVARGTKSRIIFLIFIVVTSYITRPCGRG
jgi:hypothetical protein